MNDPRFFTPMIELNCGPVFVGDFVQYCAKETNEIGKVEKFVCMVSFFYTYSYMVLSSFFFRKNKVECLQS